jgi:hypothetical protein
MAIFHMEPAPDFVVTLTRIMLLEPRFGKRYKNWVIIVRYYLEVSIQVPYRVVIDNSRTITPTNIPFFKLLEMENVFNRL